jgi:plasmid stability protein
MATLTIRNLPEKVRNRLRVRAAKRGVSMEAEARTILAEAVEASEGRQAITVSELQEWVAANRKKVRGDKNDSIALIRDRRREAILDVLRDGCDPADVFGGSYKRILGEADWTDDQVKGLKRQPR